MGNWTQTKVRVYKNTGFNASNIPDSQALLNTLPSQDLEGLYIEQERFLANVKVRTSWEEAKFIDYCRLSYGYDGPDTSMYYFVNDIKMEAHDVAVLSLTPDYWTTGDGINGFSILDGVTERVHVSDDSYGRWTGDDPLLTPVEPLKIDTVWKAPGANEVVAIETTLDPGQTATQAEAISYEDEQGEHSVSVPKAIRNGRITKFRVPEASKSTNRGTALYVTYSDIKLGTYGSGEMVQQSEYVAALRSLGLEQAIISQVRYPSSFISFAHEGAAGGQMRLTQLTGKSGTWSSGLSFVPHNCKNNLINYSNFLKFGLMSCAGNGAEFDPADLYDGSSSPTVRYIADPNPDGKPYFRFKTVNSNSSLADFWRNCIAGMQWKQVPLVFTSASGGTLNQLKYSNNENIQSLQVQMNTQKMTNQTVNNMTQAGINAISGLSINPLQDLKTGGQLGLDMYKINQEAAMYNNYQIPLNNLEHLQRYTDYAISQNVVIPTVNFPYNSEIMRDAYGNGVLVYRYRYSDNDVRRIDKLLTMYGYKVTKALETRDFTNRKRFNYIKCSDVELGATPDSGRGVRRPRWFLDGAAAQLRGGVRIWHVIPNQAYYTDNPVV